MGMKLKFWEKEKKEKKYDTEFLGMLLLIIIVLIIIYFYMKKAKKK